MQAFEKVSINIFSLKGSFSVFYFSKMFLSGNFRGKMYHAHYFSSGTLPDRFFSLFLSLDADARPNPHLSVRENASRLMIYVTRERERNKREKRTSAVGG